MVTALDALVILLVVLAVSVGLGPSGWLAGIGFAVVGWAVLAEGRAGEPFDSHGRVVLARAVLVGGLTALVVDTTDPKPDPVLAIAVLASAVVAVGLGNRLPTNWLGARFAAEVDAFFVLVLSAFVATRLGPWVLAVGVLHYAVLAAGRVVPWLRGAVPARRTRTITWAAQGIALTVVATGLLPDTIAVVVTALALAALAGSVAEDVWWLYRHRVPVPVLDAPVDAPRHRVKVTAGVVTLLAVVLVLVALVGPNRLSQLSLGAFARIPVEGLMAAALVLVLPGRARRVAVAVIGLGLGLLTVVKLLDMGFYEAFDRPFHPVFDWTFLGPAYHFVGESFGDLGAVLAVVAAALLVVGLLAGTTLAVRRLTRLALGHRTLATNLVAALAVVWLVGALVPQLSFASRSAADHVYDDARALRQGLTDGETFAAQAAEDAYRYTPGEKLLTGLRGKDVMFVFVESYGRVALEKSDSAPVIDPILDAGTEELRAAGFGSRSAFLTSPVYGGGSWMAHATLQTGLWVENQQRYDNLVTLDRMTLSVAFNRAGWRTVGVVPRNTMDWPEGEFYHYDKVYDYRNMGYRGPKFAFATVPDQYTLQHFEQTERDRHDTPVMTEIDLITSHTPYTPIPEMVDWNAIGDGKIYKPMPKKGPQPSQVWPDPTKVRAAYTRSIAYALRSVISYVQTYGDDDLVLVFLGDHQPQPIIASQEGTRDVPITVVSRDPAVLDGIDGWGWTDGLNPAQDAPVWPMDSFRDRFLSAYGPHTVDAASPPQ